MTPQSKYLAAIVDKLINRGKTAFSAEDWELLLKCQSVFTAGFDLRPFAQKELIILIERVK
jgi:hypothetical protein